MVVSPCSFATVARPPSASHQPTCTPKRTFLAHIVGGDDFALGHVLGLPYKSYQTERFWSGSRKIDFRRRMSLLVCAIKNYEILAAAGAVWLVMGTCGMCGEGTRGGMRGPRGRLSGEFHHSKHYPTCFCLYTMAAALAGRLSGEFQLSPPLQTLSNTYNIYWRLQARAGPARRGAGSLLELSSKSHFHSLNLHAHHRLSSFSTHRNSYKHICEIGGASRTSAASVAKRQRRKRQNSHE